MSAKRAVKYFCLISGTLLFVISALLFLSGDTGKATYIAVLAAMDFVMGGGD